MHNAKLENHLKSLKGPIVRIFIFLADSIYNPININFWERKI